MVLVTEAGEWSSFTLLAGKTGMTGVFIVSLQNVETQL